MKILNGGNVLIKIKREDLNRPDWKGSVEIFAQKSTELENHAIEKRKGFSRETKNCERRGKAGLIRLVNCPRNKTPLGVRAKHGVPISYVPWGRDAWQG